MNKKERLERCLETALQRTSERIKVNELEKKCTKVGIETLKTAKEEFEEMFLVSVMLEYEQILKEFQCEQNFQALEDLEKFVVIPSVVIPASENSASQFIEDMQSEERIRLKLAEKDRLLSQIASVEAERDDFMKKIAESRTPINLIDQFLS